MAAMAKYQFRIEVEPQFLPEQSAPGQNVYSFSYTITITNTGEVPAQLISRHWIIANAAGELEEVKGLGVVGHQPLLKPGEAFQYTSGCRLRTPSGSRLIRCGARLPGKSKARNSARSTRMTVAGRMA